MDSHKYSCGIYGGCFNPLHQGHVKCMLAAAAQCRKLLIVISNSPQRGELDIRLRYRWVYETVRHLPNVQLLVLDDDSPTKADYSRDQWFRDARKVRDFAGEPITAVFFGSDYALDSFWTACYPEAQPVIFPRDGISSTAIRQNPFAHWDDLPANVRPAFVRKILITGTESTGKSTLAVSLARHFNTTSLEEVGRDISMRSGTDRWMLPEDFTDILLQHKIRQQQAIQQANRLFFEDTNCLTTLFYLNYLHSPEATKNQQLAEAISALNHYDLVLLLAPTVPFVNDGDRSIDSPAKRQDCTRQLLDSCHQHGLQPVIIDEPDYCSRYLHAVQLCEQLLKA